MKKNRLVALALSAAIMVMGAGYAAWTDTVTINNSVSTGNFDINLTQGAVTAPTDVIASITDPSTPTKIKTVTLDNLYPGAEATVDVTVENDGSIDAVVDNSTTQAIANPAWLTVENLDKSSVQSLAPGATGHITYKVKVADNAPEDSDVATFDITTIFKQK